MSSRLHSTPCLPILCMQCVCTHSHMHVYMSGYLCEVVCIFRGQRRTLGFFLYCVPPYSPETVSFAEPGTYCFPVMLAASKLQRAPVFLSSPALGFHVFTAIPCLLSLNGCQAFKLRSSCLLSKCSCPLNPLPSTQFALLCQVYQPQTHDSQHM